MDGLNLFSDFTIQCVMQKNFSLNFNLSYNDETNFDSVKDIKDEINLSDYVELILFNVPEGKVISIKC